MSEGAGAGSVGAMLATVDIDPAVLANRDMAMDAFMASYPRAQVKYVPNARSDSPGSLCRLAGVSVCLTHLCLMWCCG